MAETLELRLERLVRGLRPGTTACPGALARRLGVAPSAVRAAAVRLQARGSVVVTQRGVPVDPRAVRGPYRIGPAGGAAGVV